MGMSIYNIKKWINMLSGKSILHVEQGVGKVYSNRKIKGYYNDLTNKVLKDKDINEVKVPTFYSENNTEVLFPITIFQYGLGAYDLYLLNHKKLYLNKFKTCVDWTLNNQLENGSWNAFFFIYPDAPYSAMAQGEGASLLIRAYREFGDVKYLAAAEKAINFMILPVEEGGTARYSGREITFLEYTNRPIVLNGWIFSLFGLYDYLIINDDTKIRDIFDRSIKTLCSNLSDFDAGYWSKYDNSKMIASLFYHNLHIAQLRIIYEITGESIYKEYYEKWSKYAGKFINRNKAFIVKAIQKIMEK